MNTNTVTTTMDRYQPTVDLSEVTIWDAMKLVDLLSAVSTMMNAAITPEGSPIDQYLDAWQALITDASFDIADVVEQMQPTDPQEQRARNWLLARVDLPCAEGLVTLAGPGAPKVRHDTFTAALIAASGPKATGRPAKQTDGRK
jgi:hypothetical protein